MTSITKFYLNEEANHMGLYLKDIWNFSEWEFENTHDFIQWMFPIELQSKHSPEAPIVSSSDLSKLLDNIQFKENLLHSLFKAENCWGLEVNHQRINRTRPRDFKTFDELNWPTAYHHNYLRISRALHCLTLFGLENEAKELLDYLEANVCEVYEHLIGKETINNWKESISYKCAA